MVGRVTFKPGAKIERIEKNLDGPARALKQIGALMVSESQRAFKDQAFGDKRWRPRAEVNLFGIIADFHAGKSTPPKRRFQTRPALRDTGALARSIAFQVKGNVVEVGTVMHYAEVHNEGGTVESKPLTDKVRELFGNWLSKQGLSMRRRLGWVLGEEYRGEKLKAEVPARQFIGVTPATLKTVDKIIGVSIMEVTD